MRLYTVGHSTRTREDFLSLLQSYNIEALVDARAFPSSSKFPQFNRENLKVSLFQDGIAYHWLGIALGGYRKESEGLGDKSPNTGWDTSGFRIYADYMLSDTFKSGIHNLTELGQSKKTAFMCAERLYWRCHRRLISDYPLSIGHEVWHIMETDDLRRHSITSFARIKNGILAYPAKQELSTPLFPSRNEKAHHE